MTRFITIIFYLLSCCLIPLHAQDLALFVDATDVLSNTELKGGPFCGFIDINGDYRDDIIRFDGASELYVDIQSDNGAQFETKHISNIQGGSWTVLAGDLNNDGINEIFSAGSYNGGTILSAVNTQSDFTVSQVTESNFFAQNSNFVDIDNDGYLDVFICDDDSESELYFNDGTGNLVRNNSYIDMRTTPSSDNSGNYSSVWTDIDDDGDLDLYIGKCRLGVNSSTDPRRINALFINDGGVFREAASEFGIAIGEQSWTANFGDIDNDGDQDLFIINHEARSMLFENINNEKFEEIPLLESGNQLVTEGYQSSFADFNNDGFLDILIGGEEDFLLLNNGKKEFISNLSPFGFDDVTSFALGDSNQDGFIDVITEYNNFFESKSKSTKLFRAVPNGNHYISFSLNGIVSNKNGIGAKLMLYGIWGKQTRIIKSGTGYGITNSLTARFGTKDVTEIDSLVVHWPSGVKEVFTELNTDKNYLITEGLCINELINLNSNGSRIDCNNSEVELSLENNNNYDIQWSTGDSNTDNLTIEAYDHIQAKLITPDGCQLISQYVVVDTLQALIKPTLDIASDIYICESGFPIDIRNTKLENLLWQDGSIDDDFLIEEEGQYFAKNFNECDSVSSNIVNVFQLKPNEVSKDSTIIISESMALELDNLQNNGTWYSDESGENIIGNGQVFITDAIENDTSFYFDFLLDQTPPLFTGGEIFDIENVPGFPLFEELGGSMMFTARKDVVIETVSVYADKSGLRVFEIFSIDNNELVYQDTLEIAIGLNKVVLNASVASGSYEMRTNINFNFEQFQTNSPGFKISFGNIAYPYKISSLVDIESSSLGDPIYAYFYEWEVSPKVEECKSDIFQFNIDLDSINDIKILPDDEFNIYPNPSSDVIYINSKSKIKRIQIYTTSGQLVYSRGGFKNSKPNIQPLVESGAYILEILTNNGVHQSVIFIE